MKVLLYSGSQKIVGKSGVGEALRHQQQSLDEMKIPYTKRLRDGFDVVHINTIFPDALLMALVAKMMGKKVFFYGHSTMEDFKDSFRGSNLFAGLFKLWITLCYNRGDIIITPTIYSKNLLLSYGLKPPIVVLSNGVDTEFFARDEEARIRFRQKYNLNDGDKAVISVGHYIQRKGILDFVDLAESLPQYQFYWFGYTNLNLVPKNVRDAIGRKLPNLHFPGYVDRNALKEAYCGGDLFLFLTNEETEGIVMLEALAARIPILVRDIPIYSQWLKAGEDVYKATNQEEFRLKIVQILSGELPDLTDHGLLLAQNLDIKEIGRQLKELYME